MRLHNPADQYFEAWATLGVKRAGEPVPANGGGPVSRKNCTEFARISAKTTRPETSPYRLRGLTTFLRSANCSSRARSLPIHSIATPQARTTTQSTNTPHV